MHSTQSVVACSSAKFFCATYPGQARSMTRAPAARAIPTVRSVLPESTTTISSAKATEARQPPMRSSSSWAMTQTAREARTGGHVSGEHRRARSEPGAPPSWIV